MKYGLFLAGHKGEYFLTKLVCNKKNPMPEFIVTYTDEIHELADKFDLVSFDKDESKNFFSWETQKDKVDKIIVIGWQYKFNDDYSNYIIFHDSYLPDLKGFCPTESALIAGLDRLGATAFEPVDEIDSGDIYEQMTTFISYPCKLHKAYHIVADMYFELLKKIIKSFDEGTLEKVKQFGEPTYSIWRDESDMRINWNDNSSKIHRFIDALGYPLKGAYTLYNGRLIRIHDVEPVDMKFILSDAGKIWNIEDNKPIILCGRGCLRILRATYENGETVKFKKLRSILT